MTRIAIIFYLCLTAMMWAAPYLVAMVTTQVDHNFLIKFRKPFLAGMVDNRYSRMLERPESYDIVFMGSSSVNRGIDEGYLASRIFAKHKMSLKILKLKTKGSAPALDYILIKKFIKSGNRAKLFVYFPMDVEATGLSYYSLYHPQYLEFSELSLKSKAKVYAASIFTAPRYLGFELDTITRRDKPGNDSKPHVSKRVTNLIKKYLRKKNLPPITDWRSDKVALDIRAENDEFMQKTISTIREQGGRVALIVIPSRREIGRTIKLFATPKHLEEVNLFAWEHSLFLDHARRGTGRLRIEKIFADQLHLTPLGARFYTELITDSIASAYKLAIKGQQQ